MSQKKFSRLARCGIKGTWMIFNTKMLIFKSKADLDEKISFGKMIHLLVSSRI